MKFSSGRARIWLFVLGLLLALGASLFWWHRTTPPLVARLLPESKAILYCNLSPLRAATHFDRKPVPHAAEYQRFIDATGIDVERDLNEAAFALQPLPDAAGPNGGLAFSEVFAGRFDESRLLRYLAGVAASTETYAGQTVFAIPSEGRTVRVAVLAHGMVAVSNTPTPEQIHSMLDHARGASWLRISGPTVLSEHYRDLPALSLAWGLGEVGLPFGDHGVLRIFGLSLPFRTDATFLASLRWTGALRLRLEEIAPSDAAASASANSVLGLIAVGRLAENNLPGPLANRDLQALLNDASVSHGGNRAVLQTSLPNSLLQSLLHGSGKH